jgi:phosphoribosylaminoimidazole carboxylase PurE protein
MAAKSDRPVMEEAARVLDEFGNRQRDRGEIRASHAEAAASEYAGTARSRGLEVIIAGAGGARRTWLGAMAANSKLAVLGVPLASSPLSGFDALLATVQMPPG